MCSLIMCTFVFAVYGVTSFVVFSVQLFWFIFCIFCIVCFVFFFFFKQKTAYEMRISDWSSDVCSSDLLAEDAERGINAGRRDPPLIAIGRLAGRRLAR